MSYPNLFRRYFGTQIDVLVVLFCLYLYGHSPWYDSATPTYWPMWLFLLYEPICTRFGCTLGQYVMRFRVRTINGHFKVPIWRGLVRVVVKYLLGLISFIRMPRQAQRRALHDLASGTIVLDARDASALSPSNQRLERP